MAARGIKTKIGLNIILLLLLSALIADILVVMVVQGVMVREAVSRNRDNIENIGQLFFSDFGTDHPGFNPRQELATTLIISQGHLQTLHIVDSEGNALYQQDSETHPSELVEEQARVALSGQQEVVEDLKYTWAVFWWNPGAISISIPIVKGDQPQGVISTVVPLTPIYAKLRKYHTPIFIYILINTTVLTVVGLYRIFRLYLRPIHRIVQQADDFQEESDIFFAFRQEDNELNRLSSSLNQMLTRISSDKIKLKASVASLEQANKELKNAQKEIIRAEKMASVGRLAAGIAHEIGNPIGIVLGYLDMLKQDGLDVHDKVDFLKRTEDEVQRISTVIHQLLDLARPKESQNEHVTINAVIRDIIEVMQLQPVMNDIRIESYLEASDELVWGNADQLRQVFLNLLLNAADAIQSRTDTGAGIISVRTSNPAATGNAAKQMVLLRFEDNGAGIDSGKLQNIFDPFYTTKEPGKGTGLGLAVSYMIIDGLGGTIRAQSQPEQGAVFSIELPVAEGGHGIQKGAVS